VMDNQIAYAQALSDAGHDAFTILSGQLSNLPGILQDAMTQFSAGDISAAMTEVSNYLMQLPFLVMRPMQEAWGQVAQSMANNYANVVDA
ncbi:hypothetical protein OFC55_34285, partial [Escherichia coli]|nr:hypothetical protein [Escherichia coli]